MTTFIILHIRSAQHGNASIGVPVNIGSIAAVVPAQPGRGMGATILVNGGGAMEVIEEIPTVVLLMQQAGAEVWGETAH